MGQDINQLVATARGFLTTEAYGSEERTTLNAVVEALAASHLATADLRLREVQALHAAISNRCWQAVETAGNAIRDKLEATNIAVATKIIPESTTIAVLPEGTPFGGRA